MYTVFDIQLLHFDILHSLIPLYFCIKNNFREIRVTFLEGFTAAYFSSCELQFGEFAACRCQWLCFVELAGD